MTRTKLIVVGGFLAAGKTTMLWETAKRLADEGKKAGLITNDQAPALVDTAILTQSGAGIREVSGSCFCCNFPGFVDAVLSLKDAGADVIVAEPVGSCADLSATILQPLKEKYPDLDLAPFSVMIDPVRLREAFGQVKTLTHPDALYIVKEQLKEADIILLNKCDTLDETERDDALAILREHCPDTPIMTVSAKTGNGVDEWFKTVTTSTNSGTRLLFDIDYNRYAHGEAVLGWLNTAMTLRGADDSDWMKFVESFMESLRKLLAVRDAAIGHVKLVLLGGNGSILANLRSIDSAPDCFSTLPVRSDVVKLTLNARVQLSPDELTQVVDEALEETSTAFDVSVNIVDSKCLVPGRPNPTWRYDAIFA